MTVKIRTLQKDDAPLIAKYANNKKIWDNVRDLFPHPYSVENAIEFIELFNNHETDHVFAILADDQFTGVIGAHALKDIYRITAEIGYWIAEPFWNQGIASKAVNLLVEFVWAHTDFARLEAGIFDYNPGSMRVLEKCGFEKETIKRNRLVKNGAIHDEHLYSKLRS